MQTSAIWRRDSAIKLKDHLNWAFGSAFSCRTFIFVQTTSQLLRDKGEDIFIYLLICLYFTPNLAELPNS